MTTSTYVAPVTPAMVLAMVDEASSARFRYPHGVIGLVAQPDPAARTDLERDGKVVRIRPAESALAVREALLEHRVGDWMLILTDRSEDDLGAGILSHFIWGRLRRPDPWEAVRHRFKANGIDPLLTTATANRDLATAILAATPPDGWPAAPAGVLTRNHAMRALARTTLGMTSETIDLISVLAWSVLPSAVRDLSELRSRHGDRLADELLAWLAENCGAGAAPVRALLERGQLGDLVPLGLVAHLLTHDTDFSDSERHVAQLALVRLEPLIGKQPRTVVAEWGRATTTVAVDLAADSRQAAHRTRVLARTDALLEQLDANSLAIHSELMPRGFQSRLAVVAEALSQGCATLQDDRERALAAAVAVENAWARARAHRLASQDSAEVRAFTAAIRLWRWLLTTDVTPDAALAERAQRHINVGSWADAAINDTAAGVDDATLSQALRHVAEAALARRDAEERAFASVLASWTTADQGASSAALTSGNGPVWPLEDLLPGAVIPMAKKTPVMLLVMDGMSAASANEILRDAVDNLGWVEAGLPSAGVERTAALAVLPSLTNVSRASLLCGRLTRGEQAVELSGYRAITKDGARITAELFHKKGVDTTTPGALVNDGVGAAIDDPETQLVTIVLNTIDDALDRSDPSGTVWTADAVKHLAPLLARARSAGRVVVMTADHGHIVERRQSVMRGNFGSSNRWRPAGGAVGPDEVAIRGRRVLADGDVVLAVSENLRYGPLKAGYHGGASAAEVVVPVAVLLPDAETNPLDLTLLPPQAPPWWDLPTTEGGTAPVDVAHGIPASPKAPQATSLFDDVTLAAPAANVSASAVLADAVVASDGFRAQRGLAGRLIVDDQQISVLISRLADAPGQRIPLSSAASALRVSEVRVRGALVQVQQLLNVEGYPVIEVEPETRTVVLNERLLREQFGIRRG
ncbi:BREX-2 system phosphatase PglZ [Rothia sp. ARF10]|nr:BREX-2 system phosphatase PglZ [Rothia sp. ARF10]